MVIVGLFYSQDAQFSSLKMIVSTYSLNPNVIFKHSDTRSLVIFKGFMSLLALVTNMCSSGFSKNQSQNPVESYIENVIITFYKTISNFFFSNF